MVFSTLIILAIFSTINTPLEIKTVENQLDDYDKVSNYKPKLSGNKINITSPENKTYYEAMSGYYPATYGFENDKNGFVPNDWTLIGSGGNIEVINENDGHKKVTQLYDNDVNNPVKIRNRFTDQASGSFEYWWRVSATDKGFSFYIGDDDRPADPWDDAIILSFNSDGNISYNNGFWQVIQPYNPNQWYHIKIEFDCASDWHLWIDNVSIDGGSGFSYKGSPSDMDEIAFDTFTPSSNYYGYVDALGYSWDENYQTGNNLDEGLLLSFENGANLDWIGYSLDGQANNTILGNTTIPMPEDGPQNIQVFGNNSLGVIFESNKSYFTIDLNAPITLISYIPHSVINEVNDTTTFTLSADDGLGSGISVIRYKINNSDWTDYTAPFTLSGNAPAFYNISYRATDLVGHIEATNYIIVELIDTSPPPSIGGGGGGSGGGSDSAEIPFGNYYLVVLIISIVSIVIVVMKKRKIILN